VSAGYRPFDGDAWLGRDIPLIGGPYRIMAESAFHVAEEMAFARQGRKSRVFKLRGPGGAPYALKTFHRGFSLPQYVPITQSLLAFGDIRGLRACQRRVIGEGEAGVIGEPGLTYAVLMPWIEGVAWAGVVEGRFPLPGQTCLALATQTAEILAQMEARGLVHADISSSNVLVTNAASGPTVELIDVEDMYHESFGPLPYMPDGSPGYAHPRNQGRGCRNRFGDRFAGAILLTEMLTWHEPEVREATADISVFEPTELCHGGPKFTRVRAALQAHSARLATLLERAWDSPGPSSCPRLGEWAEAIAALATEPSVPEPGSVPEPRSEPAVRAPAADGQPDRPHATELAGAGVAGCPGCGRPVLPGHATADHTPTCPLRSPSATPVSDPRTVLGVPAYDGIGFIPLFGADEF
jgi:serine/threonine protein kinase